ncbi:hypothetical protein D7X33_18095 [Butyricicoccus sp. 1XD8-22]|nr:hypothetical protein D7X33_18095 [Butyricicoccus sp. 1XD8-22]
MRFLLKNHPVEKERGAGFLAPPQRGWESRGASPFGARCGGAGVQRAEPFGAAREGHPRVSP